MRTLGVLLAVSLLYGVLGGRSVARTRVEWPGRIARLRTEALRASGRRQESALVALAEYPLGQVEDTLLRVARRGQDRTARLAVRLLADKGSLRVVRLLVEWLGELDPERRIFALRALGDLVAVDAEPDVARALRDPDPKVRVAALEALERMGAHFAVPHVLAALDDSDAKVRALAARVLGGVRDARVAPALVGAASDASPKVRAAALDALGRTRDPRCLPAIRRRLQDRDAAVRLAAIRALGSFPEPSVVRTLAWHLENATSRKEAEVALWALGRTRRPEAARVLVRALQHPTVVPVADILQGLVRMGAVAVSPLARLLGRPTLEPALVARVVETLGRIGDPGAVPALLSEYRRVRVSRGRIVSALAACASPQAAGVFLDLVGNPAEGAEIRLLAARSLEAFADRGMAERLVAALEACGSCPEDLRVLLVRLVGRAGGRRAVGLLDRMARNGPMELRREALEALGRLGWRGVLGYIEEPEFVDEPWLASALANAAGRLVAVGQWRVLLAAAYDFSASASRRWLDLALVVGLVRRGARSQETLEALARFASDRTQPAILRDLALTAIGAARNRPAGRLLAGFWHRIEDSGLRCRAVDLLWDTPLSGGAVLEALLREVRTSGPCALEAAWIVGRHAPVEKVRELVASRPGWVRVNLLAGLARRAHGAADVRLFASVLGSRAGQSLAQMNALVGLARLGGRLPRGVEHTAAARLRDLYGIPSLREAVSRLARIFGVPGLAGPVGTRRPSGADGDWLMVRLLDDKGRPRENVRYVLVFPDGIVKVGRTGPAGLVSQEGVGPGRFRIDLLPSRD